MATNVNDNIWAISTTGTLIASNDNTYHIGVAGEHRPRRLYIENEPTTSAEWQDMIGLVAEKACWLMDSGVDADIARELALKSCRNTWRAGIRRELNWPETAAGTREMFDALKDALEQLKWTNEQAAETFSGTAETFSGFAGTCTGSGAGSGLYTLSGTVQPLYTNSTSAFTTLTY